MDNVARLLVIMGYLRDPVQGCPWDLKQTFASIAPHTIEEAYEVVDAIERQDFEGLREELGDLLLQVVYYAQMAHEQDLFNFDQIAKTIADKLVRRHPHVFGDTKFDNDEARTKAWEAEKARERVAKAAGGEVHSIMDGIAAALPALTRAHKLQKRAAGKGFDWPDRSGVVTKIEEELTEARQVLAEEENEIRIAEEIGDLLFAVVNLSRWAKIDPETALRAANKKFERRFRSMEWRLAEKNRRAEDCTLEELNALWEEVKREGM
jgi:ATP diphosphatase